MDPNAALDILRRAMADEDNGIPLEVYEAFTGLDNWLSKGGFLPADWARSRSNPNMIVVESSTQLDSIRKALALDGVHKLRVWIDGDCVKFKTNEHGWSPPLGRVQEPY